MSYATLAGQCVYYLSLILAGYLLALSWTRRGNFRLYIGCSLIRDASLACLYFAAAILYPSWEAIYKPAYWISRGALIVALGWFAAEFAGRWQKWIEVGAVLLGVSALVSNAKQIDQLALSAYGALALFALGENRRNRMALGLLLVCYPAAIADHFYRGTWDRFIPVLAYFVAQLIWIRELKTRPLRRCRPGLV